MILGNSIVGNLTCSVGWSMVCSGSGTSCSIEGSIEESANSSAESRGTTRGLTGDMVGSGLVDSTGVGGGDLAEYMR